MKASTPLSLTEQNRLEDIFGFRIGERVKISKYEPEKQSEEFVPDLQGRTCKVVGFEQWHQGPEKGLVVVKIDKKEYCFLPYELEKL